MFLPTRFSSYPPKSTPSLGRQSHAVLSRFESALKASRVITATSRKTMAFWFTIHAQPPSEGGTNICFVGNLHIDSSSYWFIKWMSLSANIQRMVSGFLPPPLSPFPTSTTLHASKGSFSCCNLLFAQVNDLRSLWQLLINFLATQFACPRTRARSLRSVFAAMVSPVRCGHMTWCRPLRAH